MCVRGETPCNERYQTRVYRYSATREARAYRRPVASTLNAPPMLKEHLMSYQGTFIM